MEKWFTHGKNLLVYGDHGCGKTTMVKDFWDKRGLKYAFFSGATIDPWVDLIGIPKLAIEGGESVIHFARPKTVDENLEAIFIDEYNRSPAAVRNAVLELIQFKSINNRSFPNLKVVWAAANPPDTQNNYDVEEIDPAQLDRFHIIVKLSGKPSSKYFTGKYGIDISNGALKWYENLAPDIRRIISPRRLDYAIDWVVNCGGEARDILADERINVSQFTRNVRGNDKMKLLLDLKGKQDSAGIKKFFKSQANVQPCLKEILRDFELSNLFIENGNTEEVLAFANSDEAFSILVSQASTQNENVKTALESYRSIHKSNPTWFDSADRVIASSRAALDDFLENKDVFSPSGMNLKVSDLCSLLLHKDADEIVDEIRCLPSASMYNFDEDSSKNALAFFARIDFRDFCETNKDSDWVKKSYSLIYSAFNFFYLRDGNLQGASFAVKGCERLASAPPFALKNKGLVNRGGRGGSGKLSVREQAL
jgi:hypothetical protein